MISVTSSAMSDAGVEQEVDEALDEFNGFYTKLQSGGPGLLPAERAAIKTFLGYFLDVGGHRSAHQSSNAQEDSD